MPTAEDLGDWVRRNPGTTAMLLVVAALLIGGAALLVSNMGMQSSPKIADTAGAPDVSRYTEESGGGEFVEVKEARINAESEDAEADASAVRNLTSEHGGYVERSSKHETDLYRTIDIVARVPSDDFGGFTEDVMGILDVESHDVRNYRLPVQEELDELEILNSTLADYEDLRQEVRGMEAGKEKAELLMELTEKELRVKELQGQYQRELSSKQQMSDYATVEVQIRQRKSVAVTPDNVWNRVKERVKRMLDNLVTIAIETFAGGIELLFRTVQAIIYIVIIAIPVAAAYRLGRMVYRRYGEG